MFTSHAITSSSSSHHQRNKSLELHQFLLSEDSASYGGSNNNNILNNDSASEISETTILDDVSCTTRSTASSLSQTSSNNNRQHSNISSVSPSSAINKNNTFTTTNTTNGSNNRPNYHHHISASATATSVSNDSSPPSRRDRDVQVSSVNNNNSNNLSSGPRVTFAPLPPTSFVELPPLQFKIDNATDRFVPKAYAQLLLPQETQMKQLTNPEEHSHKAIVVKTKKNDYVTRKAYPPSHLARSKIAIYITKLAGRHPNCTMPMSATRHSDQSINVEEEFSDGADVAYYIQNIHNLNVRFEDMKHEDKIKDKDYIEFKSQQVQFCKSVARQLLEYCMWLHDVMKEAPHRNITPKTILLRRDGCVKAKFFNYLTQDIVRNNPFYFFSNCAYLAPEWETLKPETRINTDYANDIWAVGALLYGIMKGETMLPDYPRFDPYKPSIFDSSSNNPSNLSASDAAKVEVTSTAYPFSITLEGATAVHRPGTTAHGEGDSSSSSSSSSRSRHSHLPPEVSEHILRQETSNRHQKHVYDEFKKFVATASMDQWNDLFVDPCLAHLARQCLRTAPLDRPRASELVAYIHLVGGGLVQSNYSQAASTIDERRQLTKIVVPGRAYERVKGAAGQGDIGWFFTRTWQESNDAWCTDIAQLTQTYKEAAQFVARTSLSDDPARPRNAFASAAADIRTGPKSEENPKTRPLPTYSTSHDLDDDPNRMRHFGEQIIRILQSWANATGGGYRVDCFNDVMAQRRGYALIPTADRLRREEDNSASAVNQRHTAKAKFDMTLATMNTILESVRKDEFLHDLNSILMTESAEHNKKRDMSGNSKVKPEERTAIDKQRREVIKGRETVANLPLSRAMCWLRNGFMESKFFRMVDHENASWNERRSSKFGEKLVHDNRLF